MTSSYGRSRTTLPSHITLLSVLFVSIVPKLINNPTDYKKQSIFRFVNTQRVRYAYILQQLVEVYDKEENEWCEPEHMVWL